MESEWELDRIKLFQVRRSHPDWSQPQLARYLNRSLSWVKKWVKRFKETTTFSLEMFKSQSRAPRQRLREVVASVRDAILSLRDQLREVYGRVVGAKTILYHLHQDPVLKEQGCYLPRSARTVWQVLKEGGRIPTRVREVHPILRPEPMQHWEMDFGQLGDKLEFLTVVDRGTSILVESATQPHYNAETALEALAHLLVSTGLPQKLRFDNDTRFVGNWLSDGYPSALMRFLLCMGVEPDVVEPGKPYHKPFAERSVRTLKHECLWEKHPEDWREAAVILSDYRHFYNHGRANQSLACGNRPPYEAFPALPPLERVKAIIDPDAWLAFCDRRVFKRRVGKGGGISVGRHDYYVGYAHAGTVVGVLLDAAQRVFRILQRGKVLREVEIQGVVGYLMPFEAYLQWMLQEARTTPQT